MSVFLALPSPIYPWFNPYNHASGSILWMLYVFYVFVSCSTMYSNWVHNNDLEEATSTASKNAILFHQKTVWLKKLLLLFIGKMSTRFRIFCCCAWRHIASSVLALMAPYNKLLFRNHSIRVRVTETDHMNPFAFTWRGYARCRNIQMRPECLCVFLCLSVYVSWIWHAMEKWHRAFHGESTNVLLSVCIVVICMLNGIFPPVFDNARDGWMLRITLCDNNKLDKEPEQAWNFITVEVFSIFVFLLCVQLWNFNEFGRFWKEINIRTAAVGRIGEHEQINGNKSILWISYFSQINVYHGIDIPMGTRWDIMHRFMDIDTRLLLLPIYLINNMEHRRQLFLAFKIWYRFSFSIWELILSFNQLAVFN